VLDEPAHHGGGHHVVGDSNPVEVVRIYIAISATAAVAPACQGAATRRGSVSSSATDAHALGLAVTAATSVPASPPARSPLIRCQSRSVVRRRCPETMVS
jgi:RES domain-containing protein